MCWARAQGSVARTDPILESTIQMLMLAADSLQRPPSYEAQSYGLAWRAAFGRTQSQTLGLRSHESSTRPNPKSSPSP